MHTPSSLSTSARRRGAFLWAAFVALSALAAPGAAQEPPPPPPIEPEDGPELETPAGEGSQDQAQDSEEKDPNAPVRGYEAWQRMAVLAGGEWHVAEGSGKPVFRRFVPGPKGACLFSEMRNKADLEQPLPEVSVIFYDPVENEVRGIAVGANGAYTESTYHWEGDLLINKQSYHIADGLMANGQEQHRSFALVERWQFDSNESFNWRLFQLDDGGVSELISNDFTRSKKLTKLPAAPAEATKPNKAMLPMQMLSGERSGGNWNLQGHWLAGGRAMWVQRNLPNPFGEDALDVHGFHYWNPYKTEYQFIGFSQNGDLIRGQSKQVGDQVLENDYRITPFTPEKPKKDEVSVATLGETLIPLQGEVLKSSWVLAPPDEAPVVIHSELKP